MSAIAKIVPLSSTELLLGLFEKDEPCTEVKLDAGDVDGLVAALAEFRSNMTPEVSPTFPAEALRSTVDPIWSALASPLLPGKIVAIRHPAFGWIGLQFPPAEAAKLGTFLIERPTPDTFDLQTPTGSLH